MPKKKKTYSVKYVCTNCDHDFANKISFGTLAPAFLTCPNCENRTARPAHQLAEMKKQGSKKTISDIASAQDETDDEEEETEEEDEVEDKQQEDEEEDLSHLSPKEREKILKQRAEAKAQEVTESLTSVHENPHPENSDPTKRFILVGSNILNKRKEIVGYIRASDQSWEELKAQLGNKDQIQDFLRRIKLMPQSLVELYGVNPEECYFLEMLDRKWEHKRRNLPELPVLPALTDGNYDGFKESLGIRD